MGTRRLAIPLAVALAACGGPVLFVEVELPQVCVTQAGVPVPGARTAGTIEQQVEVPLTDQIPLLSTSGAETVLRLDEVRVTPAPGSAPDLSGIDTAVVNLLPPVGAPVKGVSYTRDPAAPPPTELVLRGDGVDIAPLLVNGRARLDVVTSGQHPASPWAADVKMCVHGTSKVPYLR
jgi:hypothetical protein